MKAFIQKALMAFVSITLLNVWLLRFQKSTSYRGGDATDMLSEFAAYGLSDTILYIVGATKVTAAILLLLGLRYSKLVKVATYTIAALMIGAIYFHFSIQDEWIKSFPAALLLLSSILILYLEKTPSHS